MLPIFYKGYKQDLNESDLFEALPEHKSSKLGNKLENAWNQEIKFASRNCKTPNLLKVIIKEFGPSIFGYGCIAAILELGIK